MYSKETYVPKEDLWQKYRYVSTGSHHSVQGFWAKSSTKMKLQILGLNA